MIRTAAQPQSNRRFEAVLVESPDASLGGLVAGALAAETGHTPAIRATQFASETLKALDGASFDLLLIDCRSGKGTGSAEAVISRGLATPCALVTGTEAPFSSTLPPPLNACDLLTTGDLQSGVLAKLVELIAVRQRSERMLRAEANAYRRRILEQQIELERTAQQLRESQEEILQTERTTAIEQLVVTVRHEINNPLATLIGRAQLLRSRGRNAPEPVVKALEEIEREALRIRSLMDRLDVAREGRTTGFLDRRRIKLD